MNPGEDGEWGLPMFSHQGMYKFESSQNLLYELQELLLCYWYLLLFMSWKNSETSLDTEKKKIEVGQEQRTAWASGCSVGLLIAHVPCFSYLASAGALLSLGESALLCHLRFMQLKGSNQSLPSFDLRSLLPPFQLFQASQELLHVRKGAWLFLKVLDLQAGLTQMLCHPSQRAVAGSLNPCWCTRKLTLLMV